MGRGSISVLFAAFVASLSFACARFTSTNETSSGGSSAADGGDGGATCAGAACVIAANQTGAFAIALDGTYVYWTIPSAGMVLRARKDGTGAVEPIASGQPSPGPTAITATNAYWATAGDGGSNAPSIIESSLGCAVNQCLTNADSNTQTAFLAWDGAFLYHADQFENLSRFDGTQDTQLCNAGNNVSAGAVGSSLLFAVLPNDRAITSCAKGSPNGDAKGVANNLPSGISAIAVADALSADAGIAGSDVYIAFDIDTSATGAVSIARVPSGAGGANDLVTIASGQKNAHAVAVDDTYVYWTSTGDNAVRKRRRDLTGPVVDIVDGENGPTAIAVDGTDVYWATGSGIMRHAKE